MRIDKFLNSVNITKRRSIAQDMLQSGVVCVNDKVAKPSKDISVGDIITISYLGSEKKYKILALPSVKSTPKSEQSIYVEEMA
jgi:ribosome-associated heat shock protein Hsp15